MQEAAPQPLTFLPCWTPLPCPARAGTGLGHGPSREAADGAGTRQARGAMARRRGGGRQRRAGTSGAVRTGGCQHGAAAGTPGGNACTGRWCRGEGSAERMPSGSFPPQTQLVPCFRLVVTGCGAGRLCASPSSRWFAQGTDRGVKSPRVHGSAPRLPLHSGEGSHCSEVLRWQQEQLLGSTGKHGAEARLGCGRARRVVVSFQASPVSGKQQHESTARLNASVQLRRHQTC